MMPLNMMIERILIAALDVSSTAAIAGPPLLALQRRNTKHLAAASAVAPASIAAALPQRTLSRSLSKLPRSVSLNAAAVASLAVDALREEEEQGDDKAVSSVAASVDALVAVSASDDEGRTPGVVPFAAATRRLSAEGGEMLQNGASLVREASSSSSSSSSSPLELALVVYVPPLSVEAKDTRPSSKNTKSSSRSKLPLVRSRAVAAPPAAPLKTLLARREAKRLAKKLAEARAKLAAAVAAAVAAGAKTSPAAKAKQSERRAAFYDRCVGAVDSFEAAVSLFAEYEKAAAASDAAAAAAEEDAKLAALRSLFDKSERAAARADADAGAELALSSGAVRALFERAERAAVAAEAARSRASVDFEAAVGAMVVRAERAAARRDALAAARRAARRERAAGAELAVSSASSLFVRAERAAARREARVGARSAFVAMRRAFAVATVDLLLISLACDLNQSM